MSNDILDITKWEKEYPFLEEVWNTYKEFDHITEDGNHQYDVLCSSFIFKGLDNELSRYKDFCIRLMKNLGHYSSVPKLYKPTNERCNILFNWIYNSMKEQKITNDIINKCFEEYDSEMKAKGNHINKCHYFQYNKILEPINTTVLDIFNDNMSTIETTLMDPDFSIRSLALKYVCECLKKYKYMKDKYCLNGQGRIEDYSSTCLKLEQFKQSYMWVLYSKDYLSPIIPSLDNLDQDLLNKCPQKEKILQLNSDAREPQKSYSGQDSTEYTEGYKPFSKDGETITHGNEDSPMRKTITTTIGTFAGASSLLALLYRFTPAGRLVNPKLRTTGITNNNFYGEESNGMLFDGNEHNGFNSYNIGYEAV